MKIDSASAKPTSNGSARGVPSRPSAGSGSSSAPGNTVSLSTQSLQLQQLAGNVASAPALDAAKIEQIKQALAQGTFKVNPHVVAERLLATARELLQFGKG